MVKHAASKKTIFDFLLHRIQLNIDIVNNYRNIRCFFNKSSQKGPQLIHRGYLFTKGGWLFRSP